MKKIFSYILISIFLTIIFVGIPSHTAEASSCNMVTVSDFNLFNCATELTAQIFNWLLFIVSWILSLAGYILNFSMKLTLNIKDFVDQTPAIYTVWKSIRDISGLFIIFILIFAGIKMILSPFGLNPKLGEVVKTVVIAGILINFSFFITGLGIDVSNVVSLQIYNAIAPVNNISGKLTDNVNTQAKIDGGISNIFMNSLKIPRVYDLKSADKKSSAGQAKIDDPIKSIVAGVTGIIIMLTAALSFFLAGLAFIVRFVILIMLLGFSPIMFAAFVIPQLSDQATRWKKMYIGQLTFMPVYLLLMYFALSVLSTSNLFGGDGLKGLIDSQNTSFSNYLALGVNAAIVIIMLNAPLVAAMATGAAIPKKWADTFDAGNIWKKFGTKVGTTTGGFAGRNTVGLAANRINDSEVARKFYANNPNLGLAVSKGLSKVSSASFGGSKGGYDANLKTRKKSLEELQKQVKTVKRENYSSLDKFKKAEQEAKEMDKTYISSLNKRSPMTFFMRDRANMSHNYEYEKSEFNKEKSGKLNKEKNVITNKILNNNTKIASMNTEITKKFSDNGHPLSKTEIDNLKKGIDALNEENATLHEAAEKINDDLAKIKTGVSIEDLAGKISGLESKITETK